MDRRTFICRIMGGLLAAPLAIEAPAAKVWRVGVLANTVAESIGPRWFSEADGLLSYSARDSDLFQRAAHYVDKLLKGAKPEALPIEQPTKFDLVINLKTARALGVTIPQSLLLRADEVIQ